MASPRRIVAMGGGGFSEESSPLLDDYILWLAGRVQPRVCFVPTASGDAEGYIARFHAAFAPPRAIPSVLPLFRRRHRDIAGFLGEQDVVYVGGGDPANMLAIWRLHGVDAALRGAWEAGVVLAGVSAGALCWFEAGITDSPAFGPSVLHDGLGLLPGSHCPHYDAEPEAAAFYRQAVARGLAPGLAADNGVGLRFEGTDLVEAVSSTRGGRALRVGPDGERALPVRWLGAG